MKTRQSISYFSPFEISLYLARGFEYKSEIYINNLFSALSFDSRQILVTVPQCLEILFLSPRRQDWTKKVRYVIFDEVKELRTFLTVIFAKLLLILCNEVAAWKRQNQRQKVTTIFTLCSFASFNNVVISLILKLCN